MEDEPALERMAIEGCDSDWESWLGPLLYYLDALLVLLARCSMPGLADLQHEPELEGSCASVKFTQGKGPALSLHVLYCTWTKEQLYYYQ